MSDSNPDAAAVSPAVRASGVSVPREHGAFIMLGAAVVFALIVAPHRGLAIAAAVALLAGFLARGPVERHASHLRLRSGDRFAVVAYALLGSAALVYLSRSAPPVASVPIAVLAGSLPTISWIVRRARRHRHLVVETGALALLGGAAGAMAWAGGVGVEVALAAAIALAGYAAASGPIVRAQTRKAEPSKRRGYALVGLLLLLVSAAAVAGFRPLPALAFAPRALRVSALAARGPHPISIGRIAVTECVDLALFLGPLATLFY